MKINININGNIISLSEKDNNKRIAKTIAKWVIEEECSRVDPEALSDFYFRRLQQAADATSPEEHLLALFLAPERRRKAERRLRMWSIRKLIAAEIIAALERRLNND